MLIATCNDVSANQYTIDKDQHIQYFGYVGYEQLFSNNNIDSTFTETSRPELGLNLIYNRGCCRFP